eukprot:470267-Ditylum_brightwellii.AAC.1
MEQSDAVHETLVKSIHSRVCAIQKDVRFLQQQQSSSSSSSHGVDDPTNEKVQPKRHNTDKKDTTENMKYSSIKVERPTMHEFYLDATSIAKLAVHRFQLRNNHDMDNDGTQTLLHFYGHFISSTTIQNQDEMAKLVFKKREWWDRPLYMWMYHELLLAFGTMLVYDMKIDVETAVRTGVFKDVSVQHQASFLWNACVSTDWNMASLPHLLQLQRKNHPLKCNTLTENNTDENTLQMIEPLADSKAVKNLTKQLFLST